MATLIKDVSDTAFWVAYYRAKESDRPDAIFSDPLAKDLVGERGKILSDSTADIGRYTEWAVISRTVIIDRFIERLLGEGVDAVINLGAGLDTRPYRLHLPETLEWVEVDYPNIVVHKSQVLKNERPRCKLTRVELDLADASKRRAFLDGVAPHAKRVLILTEGVILYLSPEQVAELSRELRAQRRFTYWIAEYFHPRVYRHLQKPARSKTMQNAPFKFYPDDWFGFFRQQGWVEKETRYSGEIAGEFNRKPPMPKWATIFLPYLPRRLKEQALRMAGYVVFERK